MKKVRRKMYLSIGMGDHLAQNKSRRLWHIAAIEVRIVINTLTLALLFLYLFVYICICTEL